MRIEVAIFLVAFVCVANRAHAVEPAVAPQSQAILDLALETPTLITHPGPEYADDARDYAMNTSLERTAKGRLWAAWFAGGDSDLGFLVATTSDDDGATWSTPRLVIDPPDAPQGTRRRTLVAVFWLDPRGRLWLFFDQSMGYFDGRAGVWAARCDDPDASDPIWTKPVRLFHGVTLNKPTVLKSGEWLLPVSLWDRQKIGVPHVPAANHAFHELDPLRQANVLVSTDEGVTWSHRGGVLVPQSNFDEQMMVELRDGRLWMLTRTTYGLAEMFSADGGRTWSTPQPSPIKNASTRFFLRRLASGNILLVKNGKIDERTPQRSHLTAYLSEDDGRTWRGGLLLDDRAAISYPDGFQAPDGTIAITYDRNRGTDAEILMARFNEADVFAGALQSPKAHARMLVNKALKKNKQP